MPKCSGSLPRVPFPGHVLFLYRQAGIFNLSVAVQFFMPFVTGYPVSWMVGKILVLGGIGLGSFLAASAQKKFALRL